MIAAAKSAAPEGGLLSLLSSIYFMAMMHTNPSLCAEFCARTEAVLRTRHYSPLTIKAYVFWVREFLKRYWYCKIEDLGEREVTAFLSDLAIRKSVSASTQNQALSAILFLFKQVLGQELEWMDGVVRARRRRPLPVVLSRQEVLRVFRELRGVPLLITGILYGSGLRLTECLRLRVKDIEFEKHHILVRGGKGRKDRRAILPLRLEAQLQEHLAAVRRLHAKDLLAGAGFVELPYALARKYPNAPRSWPYQWVLPAPRTYVDPTSGQRRRHHLHQTVVQKAVRQAVLRADIQKPAGCHTFRHYAGCRIMPSARPRAALCLGFSLSNPA